MPLLSFTGQKMSEESNPGSPLICKRSGNSLGA